MESPLTGLDIKPQHRDKVLVLEEHLRNSRHYQVEGDGLLFGADREYVAVHQFDEKKGATGKTTSRGAPIPWGDIPARPFIGLSDDDKNYIVETIEEHIKAAWG